MLREKLSKYQIILASASPRRQQLFKKLDVDFIVDVRAVNEIYPAHLKEQEITDYLAQLKSEAFTNLKDNELVITSDTLVWFNNKAIGKPKNKQEAFYMLRSMSGRSHTVFTSVCIKGGKFCTVINDQTNVQFKDFTEDEIHYYLENYQSYDKAGSYGIQDWIGLIGVEKIEGNYFNVMGLPVYKLYKELMRLA